jgi:hypothetical protein
MSQELIQKKKNHYKMIAAYMSIGFIMISLLAYIDFVILAVPALSMPEGTQIFTTSNHENIGITPFAGMATKGPPVPPGPPT